MAFLETIVDVLREPAIFFDTAKSEKTQDTTLFLLKLTALHALIMLPALYFLINNRLNLLGYETAGFLSILTSYLLGIASFIILTFIWSGIVHLFVRMFKGFGDYSATFKSIAYSYVPLLIVGVIASYLGIFSTPVRLLLLFAAWTWSAAVKIVGLSELHVMSKKNAAFGYFTPVLIGLILYYLIL